MDTNMVLNTSFNELVFENRHKEYGAYQIRKRYSRNVLLAAFFAVTIFTAALGSYFINMPESHAIVMAPPINPNDTIPMIIGGPKIPDKPKLKEPPKPLAAKGSTNTSVVIADSVPSTVVNDTIGTTGGFVGGTGTKLDTITGSGGGNPCTNCDTAKIVKRRNWLPNPPKDPGLDIFFAKNIKYPEVAREQGIEGVVYLTFVVDTKGDVREITILKGAHPLLDREVLRVAKFMPKWEPVKDESGEIIEYQYSKPVRFTLK